MIRQKGLTLIEMLIVIAIIAILAAVAYPSYQNYIIRKNRVEMMTEMQSIGRQIESKKLAAGKQGYKGVDASKFSSDFPKGSGASRNYSVSVEIPDNGEWVITATVNPNPDSIQSKDGNLILEKSGKKCRKDKCGPGSEWNE